MVDQQAHSYIVSLNTCVFRLPCHQGAAFVAQDTSVSAKQCWFSSNQYLGVILRSADSNDDETEDEDNQPVKVKLGCTPRAHFRDCTFEDNMHGGFFGKDLSADAERALLAANTFSDSWSEDVSRMYDYTGYDVQPWRRGWTNMQI